MDKRSYEEKQCQIDWRKWSWFENIFQIILYALSNIIILNVILLTTEHKIKRQSRAQGISHAENN